MEFKNTTGKFTIKENTVIWSKKPRIPEGLKVMITCPNTGEPLWTGILLDWSSWEAAELVQNKVSCYHCGAIHTWDKKDARLEE